MNEKDLIKEFREIYGFSKRQAVAVIRLMQCFKMSKKAALIEIAYREEFKRKRNEKVETIFGRASGYDLDNTPVLDVDTIKNKVLNDQRGNTKIK
jgi:hypothetical protein